MPLCSSLSSTSPLEDVAVGAPTAIWRASAEIVTAWPNAYVSVSEPNEYVKPDDWPYAAQTPELYWKAATRPLFGLVPGAPTATILPSQERDTALPNCSTLLRPVVKMSAPHALHEEPSHSRTLTPACGTEQARMHRVSKTPRMRETLRHSTSNTRSSRSRLPFACWVQVSSHARPELPVL